MPKGVPTWFNAAKGYGLVMPNDVRDVFQVHALEG